MSSDELPRDSNGVPDLGKLRSVQLPATPAPWFTLICRNPETGEIVSGFRIAPGLVVSVERDASVNVSPLSEFDVVDETFLRKGDANNPQVLTYLPPLYLAAQAQQAEQDNHAN